MNIKRFLIAAIVLIGFSGFAQEGAEDDCKKNRFLAGEELKIKNYPNAASYYLKAEAVCPGADFGKEYYNLLIVSLKNSIVASKDKAVKTKYKDTVLGVYDRAEKLGFVGPETYTGRAKYLLKSSSPDRKKADVLFVKGMEALAGKYKESTVSYYFLNLKVLTKLAPEGEKAAAKKRFITEYFNLSKVVTDRKFSVKSQEFLNTHLNDVVKTCDDILPELNGFMKELPQEKEAKIATVNNFLDLLDKKNCQRSKEFEMLLDTIIKVDPGYTAMIRMAQLKVAKGNYSGATATYRQAKALAPDAAAKGDIDFEILKMQYKQRSYKTAYNTAMSISGKHKSAALKMAAGCVAATANSCGASTMDRKMNYYYADDLLSRGGHSRKYSGNYPTSAEKFDADIANGQSVRLSCWGVNVTVR